jgi:uncharacterized protein with GYD domain
MPHYLIQVAYTPAAVATLVRNPQDRIEAIRPLFKKLGGSLQNGWFAFGEYDLVLICEMPDNVSVAAASLTAAAGGAVRAIKTTPLMSAQEAVAAMKKASGSGYEPPKA